MRILLIHNQYTQSGGEDLVFKLEAELLKKNGHPVELLVFSNNQINSGWTKLTGALGAVYNLKSKREVADKILKFKPDVIHVHNFFHVASPSVFYAAQAQKIPVVMTLHNFRLICPSATLLHGDKLYDKSIHQIFPLDAIIKGVYRNSRVETALVACTTGIHKILGTWRNKVTRYIALTEFSRRKFLDSSLKLADQKVLVKPNFVQDYGANFFNRDDYFLFVGRLSVEKGIARMLEAAGKQPEISFKIIGDGPMRKEVEEFIGSHSNVEYLGFRDKSFIVNQLKHAKALVFPSQWYEGFPMTILEAFSCGTPVIASDLGGPAEIITHGVNGLLVDYRSADELLHAINKIQHDSDLHQKLCINARKSYEELYTPEKNYNLLLEAYQKACSA